MRIIELTNPDGTITELIEIETSQGHFTQMLKSTYEAQQATLAANSAPTNPSVVG